MTLDEYLTAHDISSAEAGRQIGLAESTIWRIRNGEVIPMADTWVAIVNWSAGEVSEFAPKRGREVVPRTRGDEMGEIE